MSLKRVLLYAVLAMIVLFGLIQLVPYRRDHTNPPVRQEPAWNSPRTRELASRACFDCHSNETEWPWYSSIAPVSWLVQRDVDTGRKNLNFSEWDVFWQSGGELSEVVLEREMPPFFFLPLHPEARLSAAERNELSSGLRATAEH
ncbi:MAG: heme-binding domain-containing protein [Anaerolineales bacterium]|nr:heme-binding domain-containing protein [Anaerolineales bacterium]